MSERLKPSDSQRDLFSRKHYSNDLFHDDFQNRMALEPDGQIEAIDERRPELDPSHEGFIGGVVFLAEEQQLKYSMTEVIEFSGLSRRTINTFHKLGLIEPPENVLGAGVKRFSDRDVKVLKEAAELLRVRHKPRHVVKLLQKRETFNTKRKELVQAVARLEKDPHNPEAWNGYAITVMNIDGLEPEEKGALGSMLLEGRIGLSAFAEKNGLTPSEVSRLLDRAFKKVGYAFIALMKLKTVDDVINLPTLGDTST